MIYLSHILSLDTPTYGDGEGGLQIQRVRSLLREESCNASHWSFSNHLGTHIDAPHHFFQTGKTITDYPADFWEFKRVQVIDLPIEQGRWIIWKDLQGQLKDSTELLLIKTGFGNRRDKQEYWENNPGLHAELGLQLRENYPNIKVIGFDFLSVSRWQDRSGGREAHQAFLNPDGPGHPILLIEDMDLRAVHQKSDLSSVIVLPLRVEGTGGAPVTVIAC